MGYIRIFNQKNFIIGEVSSFEGELMDVVSSQPGKYQVGENVTCLLESKRFDSKILKVKQQNLGIYVPLSLGEFKDERRKVPRITTQFSALLNDHVSETVYEFHPFIEATVVDISIKGFGFISSKELSENIPYYIYVDLEDEKFNNFRIRAKVKVCNKRVQDSGFRYGCEILFIEHDHFRVLRKQVLNFQLAKYITNGSF